MSSESSAVYPDLPMRGITGELRFNEPMARHTSWKVGGVADLDGRSRLSILWEEMNDSSKWTSGWLSW